MIYFLFLCSLVDLVSDCLGLFCIVSSRELNKKDSLKVIDVLNLHTSHIKMLVIIKAF